MNRSSILLAGALWRLALFANPALAATPLPLEEAVSIALAAKDPSIARFEARAAARQELGVADSQLPDPSLSLDLENMPVDSFDFTQEDMTQARIGVRQSFPAGHSRALTREKRSAEAEAAYAGQRLEQRNLVLETRLAWLELYYWRMAGDTIGRSRQAVAELIEVVTAAFAAGARTSQDIFRSELELSLLDDRLVDAERQQQMARAALARYIGRAEAARPLPQPLPALPLPPALAVLHDALLRHPAVAVEDARIAASTSDIDIARQQYLPAWSIGAGYGVRGGNRSDFASVGISLDLPLFTAKRQDRRVSAARLERGAARLDRQTRLLELTRTLDRSHADWDKLGERVALYQQAVLKRAAGSTEAALAAYRSGVADFNDLVQARLAELDAELTLLRLHVDRRTAQARLLYLDGDDHE